MMLLDQLAINRLTIMSMAKRMPRILSLTCVASIFFIATVSAKASSYDALADYSSTNPNGVWAYGQGVTGSSFTPFTVYLANGCVTVSALSCWQPPTTTLYSPDVSFNVTGSALWGTTFLVPSNVLRIHPAVSSDVIVQWTAPTAGTYSINGLFELLDSSPTGIRGEVFAGGNEIYNGVLSGPPASQSNLAPGGSEYFSLLQTLPAGGVISFGVNNNGNFLGDSTGFDAQIFPVAETPEPRSFLLGLFGAFLLAVSYWKRKSNLCRRP